MERMIPAMAGRPTLIKGDTQVSSPVWRWARTTSSTSRTSRTRYRQRHVSGEGRRGGHRRPGRQLRWGDYAHEGRLKYIYNFLGLDMYEVETEEMLPSGDHQVRLEFAYDGGGLGKGGTATLYLDGKQIGEGGRAHPRHRLRRRCDGAGGQQVRAPIDPI